jgi:hypothetical protein
MQSGVQHEISFLTSLLGLSVAVDSVDGKAAPPQAAGNGGSGRAALAGPAEVAPADLLPALQAAYDLACLGAALGGTDRAAEQRVPTHAHLRARGMTGDPEPRN